MVLGGGAVSYERGNPVRVLDVGMSLPMETENDLANAPAILDGLHLPGTRPPCPLPSSDTTPHDRSPAPLSGPEKSGGPSSTGAEPPGDSPARDLRRAPPIPGVLAAPPCSPGDPLPRNKPEKGDPVRAGMTLEPLLASDTVRAMAPLSRRLIGDTTLLSDGSRSILFSGGEQLLSGQLNLGWDSEVRVQGVGCTGVPRSYEDAQPLGPT